MHPALLGALLVWGPGDHSWWKGALAVPASTSVLLAHPELFTFLP